ncbi:MAG: AAA family ATPase [Rickettsiales bacterium]|nr:AAA family ATPase [Rickettsiales bacterium]
MSDQDNEEFEEDPITGEKTPVKPAEKSEAERQLTPEDIAKVAAEKADKERLAAAKAAAGEKPPHEVQPEQPLVDENDDEGVIKVDSDARGLSPEEVSERTRTANTAKISKGVFGTPEDIDESSISMELTYIWAAHIQVGLKGKMCLFTPENQYPWRAVDGGLCFWFGPDEIEFAIEKIKEYYNGGVLPNTPLLLNPIVHHMSRDGTAKPIGSGIMWCTALALGVDTLSEEAVDRIDELGVFYDYFERVDNKKAGLKVLAFSDRYMQSMPDGIQLETNKAFYELIGLDAPLYYPYYLLSSVKYLSLHGLFHHSNSALLMPSMGTTLPAVIYEDEKKLKEQEEYYEKIRQEKRRGFRYDDENIQDFVLERQMDPRLILDARFCWNNYDRIHTLYKKWGRNPKHVPHNNRFYDLCARDLMLFDATGPMRKGADESFEFLVPGLLPRGAITILAASGGCGKSSIAHELCIYCATDYHPEEQKPFWLGQPVNTHVAADGICVYFSGEDGPAIINARAELYDPENRAQRLQFHRADFGSEEVSFAQFITDRLMNMPNIPLLVVDPARKYLDGDEEDSEVVNEFFFALEELAMTKNCAVVVVHHLKKGAKPKSIPEVLDELRGSQVFIDRARVVLGMFREGIHTIVGLAKNNIPPSLGMVTEERVFVRNPKTLKLMWLPGEDGVRRDTLTQEQLDQMEYESFKRQVDAAKDGGHLTAENEEEYVPPSLRDD